MDRTLERERKLGLTRGNDMGAEIEQESWAPECALHNLVSTLSG